MRLILIAVFVALLALPHATAEGIASRLERADLLLLADNREPALPLIRDASNALMEANAMNTAEGIAALRLQVAADINRLSPGKAAEQMRRVLDNAVSNLGADSSETLRCRLELAAQLVRVDSEASLKEALTIYQATGNELFARAAGVPSRDVARAAAALGLLYLEPGRPHVSFRGDVAKPLYPQVQLLTEYSPKARQGFALIDTAIQNHKALDGDDSPAARAVDLAVSRWKSKHEPDKARIHRAMAEQLVAKLRQEAEANARARLTVWWVDNPPPNIYICRGGDAYAYHKSTCQILQNCDHVLVGLRSAIVDYDREPCLLCSPMMGRWPPDDVTRYECDGVVTDMPAIWGLQ